ncbi:MAG: DegT/DnrJ/EryC1/StrS family aminotransferase [Nitrospirae bacterium]|nr:DegT/DnrJ/EryC1/StrS family aminotransferase [Nitrospirota bacterium]
MIPHNQPWIGKEEADAVRRVILRRWPAPGPEVAAFERELASWIGKGCHGVALSSGSAALHLALQILGVGRGDEVIMPTYVCSALLNAAFYVGAKPVLVDVNDRDFNLTADHVEKKLRRRTKVVVVPHLFGFPAGIHAVRRLGVPVIEDCAQAIGAEIGGRRVGITGDISIFSFHATKMMTTGHGGMLVTRRKEWAEQARDLRDYDQRPTYKVRYNYAMTDVAAAVGRVQLRKLPEMIRRRRRAASLYLRALPLGSDTHGPFETAGTRSTFYRYVLRAPSRRVDRLRKWLETRGVKTVVPIRRFELLHRYLGQDPAGFSQAEKVVETTLSIPVYPALPPKSVARISGLLRIGLRMTGPNSAR